MAECNSIECNSRETPNMYPNLNATPLNAAPLNDQQQFRLKNLVKLKIILLQRLKKEN